MLQSSGVLIVGPGPTKNFDFGADHVNTFAEAQAYLQRNKPSVLVLSGAADPGIDEFCEFADHSSPQSLWVVEDDLLKPSQIIHWNNCGRLYALIENLEDPELEKILRQALEASGETAQNTKLVELFEDQSQQLKRLTNELEARVARRHKGLRRTLQTLEQTKTRLEAFHKALLGIHRASTVLQMEQTLNEALRQSMNMLWVKVRFASQSLLRTQAGASVQAIEIPLTYDSVRGEVLFAKANGQTFNSEEVDFLQELTEALALALVRLHRLEQAETMKAQWQATFDSIPHALCLTNADFEILKLNAAFQQACSQHSFTNLIGKNCFEVFFGAEFQPPQPMESPFSFRNARTGIKETEHFEIVGQRLGLTHDNQAVQLILLRSITEEVRFERRIFEGSKLAELGTIGSSIAHELNNPLGGMLSFLQLILMDVRPGDDLFPEIKGMEQGVLRCRDIVLNLLSFARKHDLSDISQINLFDVIERSVKLIELQSKSMGIEIQMPPRWPPPLEVVPAPRGGGDPQAMIRGSQNALSQALCNLLQNSLDALGERLKKDPLYPGKISLQLALVDEKYQLRLTDNGTGIKPELQSQIFNPLFTTRDPGLYSGMGLTTAFTIISEHQGTLEILSQTGSGTTAIISLPRA